MPVDSFVAMDAQDPESGEMLEGFDDQYELSDEDIIAYVKACFEESKSARHIRDLRNQINMDAYHCRPGSESSEKIEGQSNEFIPKITLGLEQFAAYIQRGMVSFGNYFDVELSPNLAVTGKGPLSEGAIVRLIRHRLEDPEEIPPGYLDFPTLMSDAIKSGGLKALIVAKVTGRYVLTRRLAVDLIPLQGWVTDPVTNLQYPAQMGQREQLRVEEDYVWRSLIELIPFDDYYPDPKNRGLYEIHRTCVDLHEVIELSQGPHPEYDPEEVNRLVNGYPEYTEHEAARRREEATNEPESETPSDRKEVELLYFVGTILDKKGRVAGRNVCCTVANDHYLIQRPVSNPAWHQESPFIACPLLRVPFSTFHKGLFDHAVGLNLAMNALFNLIVDSGIGAVWGVRQIKLDMVDNADDFANGIPMGSTIFVKPEVPDGVPVMMQLMTGQVPPDALATYNLLDREIASAMVLSDTARAQQPRKEVSATATASADQATGAFIDSIIAVLEQGFIRKVLRLFWLNMLQNCDDWNTEDVVGCIGPQAAAELAAMSPARRFAMYAQGARFKVNGLSSMVARTREFQKMLAVFQAISQMPMLQQAFMMKFSPEKILMYMLRAMNIDPDDYQMTEEEKAMLQDRIAQLPQFSQMARGAQGDQQPQNGVNQQPESPVQQTQAAIAQMNQPPQGL